ncbi:MAG TPA: lmo0937 family membrane protein [Chloroflexia bacterium]|nr:lmo0937 family membrane protein [Chloroflexia bacterium]
MGSLANILWTVVVILVVLWLLGLVLNIGGGIIHILLVIAVIVIVYNLLTGRRGV